MNPRDTAISFYQRALEADKNPQAGAPDLKYQLLSSSVVADPTMSMGFYEIGNINGDNWWRDAAVACYRRALELSDGSKPGDMTPDWRNRCMTNLAHNLHHLGRNREAKKWVGQAIKNDPRLANAWLTLSLIQNVEGHLTDAVTSARTAMSLEKTPAIELTLAFALMYSGDYAEGLKHFQARVEYILRHFLSYPYPRWQGESDKTVFLISDQGIGDVLSFSRFVPLMLQRCKFVHMRIQPELIRLFRALFQRHGNLTIEPMPCPFPPAEYWTSFMCLPTALGLNNEQIADCPTLECPAFDLGTGWKSPMRNFHIGVTWTGSKKNWINHWRSFPLKYLLDLYSIPGIQLYSLQMDENAEEIHKSGSAVLIRDLRPAVRDVCDTIGILRNLDLVISCESLVPHICAMTKTECWIPYSYHGGDFRLGRTEKGQLWNPYSKVFKQNADAEWGPVFQRIENALRSKLAARGR